MYFLKLLPDKGIVLDIGANLGVMSYYLAKDHSNREVLAFEPIPYNFQNLKKIAKKFNLNNLKIFQLALGDNNGTTEMILPVINSVRLHGLAHVKHESIEDRNEGVVFQCPIQKLDDFEELQNSSLNITGIKIDVENFEYFVLKGARNLLKKHMPVIYCELWDNENRLKTMQMLTDLGYKTHILKENKLLLYNPHEHTMHNFFFIKS